MVGADRCGVRAVVGASVQALGEPLSRGVEARIGLVAVVLLAAGGGYAWVQAGSEPPREPIVNTFPTDTVPPLAEVRGTVRIADTLDATDPGLLGLPGDLDVDPAAVDEVVLRVAARIDTYLGHLQAGTDEPLVLDAGWLDADHPGGRAVLSSLASRGNPVAAATYDVVVEVDDGPSLAAVDVAVTRTDGSVTTASLLFDVHRRLPSLLLVAPGGDA